MDAQRQGTTMMTAFCCFIAVLLIIQLWIVSASLDALLSDDRAVLVPAGIASFALFGVNVALLGLALRVDRRIQAHS
jgi:hypothetical protein